MNQWEALDQVQLLACSVEDTSLHILTTSYPVGLDDQP
jgi:hypothetical protein